MKVFSLPHFGVFDAWRGQARTCILAGITPEGVSWQRPGAGGSLFGESLHDHQLNSSAVTNNSAFAVPRRFLAMAEIACNHSSATVFDQLYQLLLRVMQTPSLIDNPADPDVARIFLINKDVSRDAHKMKAFVRFKDVGKTPDGRRQFASWFEPEHYIVDYVSGFFARRFADMDWVIETPKGCVSCVGNSIAYRPFAVKPPALRDDMDELWRTYYANIFNPARLKVKAMTAEMPRKYWKNLPEAALITELVHNAERRSVAMQTAANTTAPASLDRFKAKAVVVDHIPGQLNSLVELHVAARNCQRCDLCHYATQTVCGEGPADAKLMFVGEQPGDLEDLTGKPLVGPAGQLFDQALVAAGIERSKVYVTNAVKHFKFTSRGKHRLHQRPNSEEIDHCRWWLSQELNFIRPKLVVAMGATALKALTGDGTDVTRRRGQMTDLRSGTKLMGTYHPSAILRQPHADVAAKMQAEFVADLTRARFCA